MTLCYIKFPLFFSKFNCNKDLAKYKSHHVNASPKQISHWFGGFGSDPIALGFNSWRNLVIVCASTPSMLSCSGMEVVDVVPLPPLAFYNKNGKDIQLIRGTRDSQEMKTLTANSMIKSMHMCHVLGSELSIKFCFPIFKNGQPRDHEVLKYIW